MADEPQTPEQWAQTLKSDWERRAQSPSRDFYVASHTGWNQPERWQHQAELDLSQMLTGLDADAMRDWHVLEIGCGVGRLARPLATRTTSYTGFDIAPGMVAEARDRCADLGDKTRFFEGSGLNVPDEARDRRYHFVLSLAVFIHCPLNVIESLFADSWSLLEPGGVFRAQLLGNPEDTTGIDPGSAENVEVLEQNQAEVDESTTAEQAELIDDHPYMGHAFTYAEVESLLDRQAPGARARELFRPHGAAFYLSITR